MFRSLVVGVVASGCVAPESPEHLGFGQVPAWGAPPPAVVASTAELPLADAPDGKQDHATVALQSDGRWTATYTSRLGGQARNRGRQGDAAGLVAAEIVQSPDGYEADHPQIVASGDGYVLVVHDAGASTIVAGELDSAGEVTSAYLVLASEAGGTRVGFPDVVGHPSGALTAIWYEEDSPARIWGQRFTPDLVAVGGPAVLRELPGGAVSGPVAVDADGEQVVVAWAERGAGAELLLQRFDADLVPLDLPTLVDVGPEASRPDVAVGDDGDVAVVWRTVAGAPTAWGRLYDPGLNPRVPPTALGSGVGTDKPAIASLGDAAVVSWVDDDGDGTGIALQVVDFATALPLSARTAVNETVAGAQDRPDLAARWVGGVGSIVVTWEGETAADLDVFGRVFTW